MVLLGAFVFPCVLTLPVAQTGGAYPHSKAEVVFGSRSVRPGGTVEVGLRFKIDPGWHLYWQNPGDSGMPPTVKWTLPKGWKAGDIEWPTPERIDKDNIVNFVYEKEVVFPVRLTAPENAMVGSKVAIGAQLKWLCCREACIPGSAKLSHTLTVAKQNTPDPAWGKALALNRKRLPQPLKSYPLNATRFGNKVMLKVRAPGNSALPSRILFYPADNYIDVAPPTVTRGPSGVTMLELKVSEYSPGMPSRLRGLLVAAKGQSFTPGVSAIPVDIPIPSSKP